LRQELHKNPSKEATHGLLGHCSAKVTRPEIHSMAFHTLSIASKACSNGCVFESFLDPPGTDACFKSFRIACPVRAGLIQELGANRIAFFTACRDLGY
jgi:hypothetical protein